MRVTAENARRNGVAPLVKTVEATGLAAPLIRRHAPYDLIFANILARPLVALAPAIAAATARHGHVILAGLTREQERQVLAAYRARALVPAVRIRQDHWSTLVLHRLVNLASPPQPRTRKNPAWTFPCRADLNLVRAASAAWRLGV